jgi:hypothetical protein
VASAWPSLATDGVRTLKPLNIVDEYTRECPAIVVGRSIDGDQVVATLDCLALQCGAPAFVRFDIHSEYRPDCPVAARPAA